MENRLVSIVVAYDKNRAIGTDSQLPWGKSMRRDLNRLRQLTLNKTIIMGRKTYDSIGHPLDNRQNIVLTNSLTKLDGIITVNSISDAMRVATSNEIFILGGAEVYKQALEQNVVDLIYATEISAEFNEATVFFPGISQEEWREISRTPHKSDDCDAYDSDYACYQYIAYDC